MTKSEEFTDTESCLNKADLDETLFVLLVRDEAAPATVRFWIEERIRLGLNTAGDPKLVNAERCAQVMEAK